MGLVYININAILYHFSYAGGKSINTKKTGFVVGNNLTP